MTDDQKFQQADDAAKAWVPSFVKDGLGLFPEAPTMEQLSARRREPILGLPTHAPFPITQPLDMEMEMSAGAPAGPPAASGSGGGS